ncbi:ribosomal protein S18-alanine N-acetyltransferase [Limosilactobacillus sp. STM2_1]|uniref:Ribosomal protein S18-alanine N-acetyltransferase n=1 Tax=Limosilactobacillus rudii TaxID=2759755 RepID=A0A7W3UMQ5_9LACO|nr:ribosomal protein S18-alanine N-acetyltransferase [Limosilactobacillus rudii]MBB1080383.1 ribosomal protein S18-alanine N-acetyltransferase [Limosilactobacillus rudii]MBB1098409.1 ribosomal protein S18-alanine N-acetyltransferase [Limosilactobacillus rudii]MCD7135417.1 ribosomal protein S18-alanine N-acetyltransferase [Limosilactobacillus rudii]
MFEKFKEWFATTGSPKRPCLDFTRRVVMISGHQYIVRMADDTDIDTMVTIEERIYGKAPWSYAAFRIELQRPHDRLYLVIEDDQQVVGFIGTAVDWYHYDLHITNVGITPSYQGKGIGTYLISTTKNYARHLKLHSMSLEVRVHNFSARKLYESLGFKDHHIKRRYYLDNHEDAVDMQANLLK